MERNRRMILIQVYAPTLEASVKEVDIFHDQLTETTEAWHPKYKDYFLILGDFNCQIGGRKIEEDMVIGNYVYGKETNRNGWKFLRWCEQQKLKIVNTFFKK